MKKSLLITQIMHCLLQLFLLFVGQASLIQKAIQPKFVSATALGITPHLFVSELNTLQRLLNVYHPNLTFRFRSSLLPRSDDNLAFW